MVTIKEVAELANVSQATVSRAINGHASVKEKNRVKVLEAIEKLGYKPNSVAQALASNRSNSVGMLVASLSGPFYGPLMHSTEDTIYKEKLHLIVTSGQESEQKEAESLDFLLSKKVDGLIVHADKLSDNDLLDLAKQTPALVVLNRFLPELADQCIYIDNELGGYLATRHLLENGHTRVACITGPMGKTDCRDRLQGYRNALAEFGIEYDASLVIEGRFDHTGNPETVGRLLDRDNGMTAVFCQNDNIALAVYDVCSERGIKIGEDLSVVGFDNDPYTQHIRPRLTTVTFPVIEMGHLAGLSVIKMLNKTNVEIKNKLTPELVERNSVKKLK